MKIVKCRHKVIISSYKENSEADKLFNKYTQIHSPDPELEDR